MWYWTDKGFTARLQRAWDRLWKRATAETLSQCCVDLKATLPGSLSNTGLKDVVLGGFKAFLKGAAGVADVIPDPAGTIVKMIAGTGVKVMDVLDVSRPHSFSPRDSRLISQSKDIDDNKNDAKTLGGHIRSLVQAVIQYLPHKEGMPTDGVNEPRLEAALGDFLGYAA